jgi:hypothetical protein
MNFSLHGEECEEERRCDRDQLLLLVPSISRQCGLSLVICHDKAGMSKTLPEEGTALAAKHDQLGELFPESVLPPQGGVQLLPVLGVLQMRLTLQHMFDLIN